MAMTGSQGARQRSHYEGRPLRQGRRADARGSYTEPAAVGNGSHEGTASGAKRGEEYARPAMDGGERLASGVVCRAGVMRGCWQRSPKKSAKRGCSRGRKRRRRRRGGRKGKGREGGGCHRDIGEDNVQKNELRRPSQTAQGQAAKREAEKEERVHKAKLLVSG